MKDFDELNTLKLEYDSIIEGLSAQISKQIKDKLLKEVFKAVPDPKLIEANSEKTKRQLENKLEMVDIQLSQFTRELDRIQDHFVTDLQNYVALGQFTKKTDEIE